MDKLLLRKKIDGSGYKLRYIAGRIGLTYAGFLHKMKGRSEFTLSEVQGLSDVLGLGADERNRLFFAHIDRCSLSGQIGGDCATDESGATA